MAAAYAHALGSDWLDPRSAVTEVHTINSYTITIMAEDNIDISQQSPIKFTPAMLHWADVVITVCKHTKEYCPPLPSATQAVHWQFTDPPKTRSAADKETLQAYRDIRIAIKHNIKGMIGGLKMMARNENSHTKPPTPPR